MYKSRSGLFVPDPDPERALNPELAGKFYWMQDIHYTYHPPRLASRPRQRDPDPQDVLERVRRIMHLDVENDKDYQYMRDKLIEWVNVPDDRKGPDG